MTDPKPPPTQAEQDAVEEAEINALLVEAGREPIDWDQGREEDEAAIPLEFDDDDERLDQVDELLALAEYADDAEAEAALKRVGELLGEPSDDKPTEPPEGEKKFGVRVTITKDLIDYLARLGLTDDELMAFATGKMSDATARRLAALIEADEQPTNKDSRK